MSEALLIPADRADLHRKMDVESAKLIDEKEKPGTETERLNAGLRAYSRLLLATMIIGSPGLIGAIACILIALHK